MSISINPIFPVIAAQGAAPDLVLKPGTVIDAEVLKLLSDDLVRIAISGLWYQARGGGTGLRGDGRRVR